MHELAAFRRLRLVPGPDKPIEHLAERFLGRNDEREALQPRAALGRLRRAGARPGVQRQPMRKRTARAEIGEAELRRVDVLAKADQVAIEGEGRLELGDMKMDVTDLRLRR